MKTISWSELKQSSLKDVKSGECLEVTGDGELAFYAVVKPEGIMKDKVVGFCGLIDSSRGF